MKRSIFDEQTSKALKSWHDKIKKKTEGPVKAKTRTLGGSPPDSPEHHHAGSSSDIEMAARKRSTSPRRSDDNLEGALVDIPLGNDNNRQLNHDLLSG